MVIVRAIMKGELLKRLFRAIANRDIEAIDKLTYLVIEDERSKGHTLLAQQLENIKKTTKKKILLYGVPGCGKTLGAERLAWNTGLPLLKVRFDAMVSSFLGETASNLRSIFDKASENPCLLFLDECDSIAKSREDDREVGEIKRVVNAFLQILEEYESSSGLLVAATNLNKSLDTALWRRFDDLIEVPLPGEQELESIVKQTLSAIEVGCIDWALIVQQMSGFSAAQAVRVAQDAAKRAILEREELVIQEHLVEAIEEIKIS